MSMLADHMGNAAESLDVLGLELALREREALDADFGGCVVSALETVKGTLLFQMEIDAAPERRKVAAVCVGQGEAREFAMIVLPEGAGSITVERAQESGDPLAAIAPSYAGLVDVLDAA
ncbi:MAG: hypothetical protein J0H34_21820 [Rhizobiales bacterium]|nr:hypothetical protein [Hyphomicrobiales bacterium]